jgi:hypothetical protein
MSPFEAIGDKPRWRVIYELLPQVATGDTITYATMGAALGLDPDEDRHTIQMAVRRAAREHEVSDNRVLEAVPNAGYRIVEAPEQLTLARRDQRKAGRALARGHSKAVHVDLTGVDPDTRGAFEVVARAFALQMDFNRRLDIRQARLEEAIGAMSERTDHTEDELAELRARLARLEEGGTRGG